MQTSVPELTDLSQEPPELMEEYGAEAGKDSFANNCLLARRLLERGVKFVQLCDAGWDHHFNIPRVLPRKCEQVDKPTAALIKDLKRRGMLDDTIVVFAGEFGRTPYCEGPLAFDTYGRDHNALACSTLVAGGGFRRGYAHGATDEWGWSAAENVVHQHDLHATILHQLGLDHLKLTVRAQGRDFRLTDVGGERNASPPWSWSSCCSSTATTLSASGVAPSRAWCSGTRSWALASAGFLGGLPAGDAGSGLPSRRTIVPTPNR
jgi:hypothetical protein